MPEVPSVAPPATPDAKNNKSTSKSVYLWLGIICLSAVSGAVISITFYICHIKLSEIDDVAKFGAFGDYIGGTINPIFSFLSLIAIIITVIVQTIELSEARIEARGAHEALKQQVEIGNEQLDNIRYANRVDITIKMLDRWHSERMINSRAAIENRVFHLSDDQLENIDIFKMISVDMSASRGFDIICQFICDLNSLCNKKAVEADLVKTLFTTDISIIMKFVEAYVRWFSNNPTSLMYQEKVSWYHSYVISFKKWI